MRPTSRPLLRRPALATAAVAVATTVALVGTAGTASAYVVRPGDTLSGIASAHGVPSASLVEANDLDDPDLIIVGATLVIPGSRAGVTHVVQPGETLGGIAAAHGVSVADLAAANGITNPDLIRAGTTLAVQGGGSAPTATVAAPSGPASSPPTSGSVARGDVRALISEAAQRHGWRPAVPLGLAMQESGWNNSVVSSAGAVGIMQVLPATAEWVELFLLGRELDLHDPADNVAAGMAYLDHLYARFDADIEHTLAAYFEGPERVAARGPSESGRRYAANVLALAERYR